MAVIAGLGLAAASVATASQAAVSYEFQWFSDETYSELIGAFKYTAADFITAETVVAPGGLDACTVTVIASACASQTFAPDSTPYNEADNDVVVFAYDQQIASRGTTAARPGFGNHPSVHYFEDGAFAKAGTYDELVSEYFSRLTVTVSPAPEPGTWALMLGGFGVMGSVLRRRVGVSRG